MRASATWLALLLLASAASHARAACLLTTQPQTTSLWRVTCADKKDNDDGDDDGDVALDPARTARFVLGHDTAPRVDDEATTRDVLVSASFARVAALESAVVTSFTVQAEPRWVHPTPVTIDASAFAKLHALETLTLENVPLATPTLHLVLPQSVAKIVIVGCKLERLTIEIVGGGDPSSLREIDLHANNLVDVPDVFFSLPANLIDLDVRLNKLSTISVSTSHAAALKRWMEKGVLQIDNLKNPCPAGYNSTQVKGLSQVFDVCVISESDSQTTTTIHERRSETDSRPSAVQADGTTINASDPNENENETAYEAIDILGPPPATVHAPVQEPISTKQRHIQEPSREDIVSNKSSKFAHAPTIYIALVCLGVLSALLFAFSFALFVARIRQNSRPKESKSRSSLLTSAGAVDFGLSMIHRRSSDASSSSSEATMMTPLPDFKNRVATMKRPGRSFSGTSASATPIGRNGGQALYTTISTPCRMSNGYEMSKSLQSLIGVSQFTICSQEKETESRYANKAKLRSILDGVASHHGSIEVNKAMFICSGKVTETEAGAFALECHPSVIDPADSTPQLLLLKVYVEQDIRIAIKEYRALLVMQSNTCKQFVSQMVATEMEKQLDGLKCAAIVLERGSATTFRHIVRGRIDKTKQFEVVQQLHAVVKALDCLHERQFIHGGLHLDAMAVHLSNENHLKFRDLEHAARFGDIIFGPCSTATNATLEYLPPEMARHLLCSGVGTRPSSLDTMEADSYQVLRASTSYDTWCLGILILKIYANTKQLDEFHNCVSPDDFYQKLSDDSFDLERSLQLYVHHDEVRDLARACLCRDPRKRPKIAGLLTHRVFRAYDRLGEGDLVASFHTHRLQAANKVREMLPPTLWLFLPPRELGLQKIRTIDEWVTEITNFQHQERQVSRFRSAELMFPLLFLCENSLHVNSQCSATGYQHSQLRLPASLLPLAMPLVQESTLFLEAKAIISDQPALLIPQVSGLGLQQWNELMKFYRALETMMLAPISSFSLLLLKPLEELLAGQDPQHARQVLDELKCLIFSQEKRDHVLSLLDILKTISINSDLDDCNEEDDGDDDDLSSVSEDGETASSRPPSKEWSRLRKCEVEREAAASMPITRWLCRRHWECEMECEV